MNVLYQSPHWYTQAWFNKLTQHIRSVATINISFFASETSSVAEVDLSPIFLAADLTFEKIMTYLKNPENSWL